MINCIAIDDEPLALQIVEKHCDRIPFLNLKQCFLSIADSTEYLSKNNIDVIFLDINMPDVDGLQVRSFLLKQVQIVYITAHVEFAIDSYKVNATDYIVKPVSYERLYESAIKCVARMKELQKINESEHANIGDERILVKSDSQMVQIEISQIAYVEGLKDYVKIILDNEGKIITRESLKIFEERLKSYGFIRIHRSFIVSLRKITSFKGGMVLINNKEIPIGKMYKSKLFEYFDSKYIFGNRLK